MPYAEVKKALGRGEVEQHEFAPLRCGMHHPFVLVKYPSAGLIFNFPGKRLSMKSAVSYLTVVRPNDAMASGRVSLWSKRAEVLASFGTGDTTAGSAWLYYGKRGIEFEFSEEIPDSMVAIHLFEPRSDSQY